jgi:hypothetical protein
MCAEYFPDPLKNVYTGSAKKMYTHFNRQYLCIVFEVELIIITECSMVFSQQMSLLALL